MARRKLNRLSAVQVAKLKAPGYYADGAGLYLQVSSTGTKSWIFRYARAGREREMGLGPLHTFTLAQARERATAQRILLADGIDPIEHRRALLDEARAESEKSRTFADCAAAYIKAHRASWKSATHAAQWAYTLEEFTRPFAKLPVQRVDTALVLKALEPIWTEKHETARRTRARIEAVLDWATVRGFRKGDNPARWKGHLQQLLANVKKRALVEHHAALPYQQLPAFIRDLRALPGTSARALEFLILTAARTSEVLKAKPEEIDGTTWTIPAERMKSGREHRVPLSPRALELAKVGKSAYLFPGPDDDAPLSQMALLMLLRRMGREDLTVHGFRSTFRDWTAEQTNYPREVAEMALAHAIGDQTEAAYRRGDLFEKRRKLMQEWARYCERPTQAAGVTPIRKRA